MIQKRFIITGMIQVGEFMRLILYPNDPVKKKNVYNMMEIAISGDPSQMQKDAIIDSIISGNPPTIYVTQKELYTDELKIGNTISVKLEVE